MLGVRRFGTGPALVALHGFTYTGAQFADLAGRIGRTIVAPDLPGHGRSGHHPTDIDAVCEAVAGEIERFGVPVDLLGYSQGGRVALLTALRFPSFVDRLVLVSANPGISADERAERAAADVRTAERIRSSGIDRFLDEWTTTGITSTAHLPGPVRTEDLTVRRDNTAEGLALAIEGYGQGSQPSAWERLGELSGDVLVVTGSDDERYADIGRRVAEAIDRAEHRAIPGARHNPMLDTPEAFAAAVSEFLDRPR
jgi:2-succinyl-6-hydroxy-2,4-cyclohexadiene-1-carboxylate synthase